MESCVVFCGNVYFPPRETKMFLTRAQFRYVYVWGFKEDLQDNLITGHCLLKLAFTRLCSSCFSRVKVVDTTVGACLLLSSLNLLLCVVSTLRCHHSRHFNQHTLLLCCWWLLWPIQNSRKNENLLKLGKWILI